jgi:hypothetical protein
LDGVVIDVVQSDHLIEVHLTGRPAPMAIVDMLHDLNALIEKDASLRVLIDENHLRPSFIGPGDIGRFVAAWRKGEALRSARLAVFVSNPAMYGLNRMFQGLADAEGNVRVFHDREQAMKWLDGDATG